ncbi:polymorphic toxin-type HINT domain-containing protein [Bernardetia sp.]|uniref:polymorphic toxin-type HINT domain-containing protein n=1 Tax=Bernardetia sp. TaxID=1937974 RepID=UPI0025B93FDB|nr:polymorphic toxin-type HINT domain-containing protein [Bernardetia sp.]
MNNYKLLYSLLLLLPFTLFGCKNDKGKVVDNTLQLEAATLPPLFTKSNYTPNYYHVNPYELLGLWGGEPIAKSFYSEKDIKTQQKINKKTTDGIMTYSPVDKEIEWTEIDKEEITPYTWKWADFELLQVDGTLTTAKLRRPNWWLKKHNATKAGDSVYLDIPELGAKGWAKLKAIRVNQLDTRFWEEHREGDYLARPITGKFIHESKDLYHLTFSGDSKPLGVTGGHLIWSEDRKDWIPATELKIGEHVRTMEGTGVAKLKKRVKDKKGYHKVYNLEIYRDHNFQVTKQGILVHNTCLPDYNTRQVMDNGGNMVERRLVANGDDLFQVAEHYLGQMKSYKEIKDGWFEGILPDGTKRRVEFQMTGEPVMGEGPHVKVVDYDKISAKGKPKGRTVAKYFIEGQEEL